MSERITIKEIALLAEVSIGTVDRVLHDRGRVADATKEKILAIAQKGNYSSNIYARHLKLNKTYQIAVLLPNDNPYWEKHRIGVARAVAEHANMGFSFAEFDISNLNEATRFESIDKALASSPDGLILMPSMLIPGGKSHQILRESGIPYVFVDSTMEDDSNLAFIGQDAFQSGRMAGQLLSNPYDNNYHVYIVTFTDLDSKNKAVKARIAGLTSFLKEKKQSNITEVNLHHDQIDIHALKKQMTDIGKPIHLFIPTSKSYLIANDLLDIKKSLNLRMVGYDLVAKNMEYLNLGIIDYIIDQQPINQGYLAAQALYRHLILQSEVNKVQHLPLDIITKENVMYCDF